MKRSMAALSTVALSAAAYGTILHFDSEIAPGALFADYGDRVSKSPDDVGHTYGMGNGWTPHIEMDSRPLDPATRVPIAVTSGGVWGGGYGDLSVVAWAGLGPAAMLELEFLPHPGYAVVINSFDAAGFVADQIDQPVYFADASNTIIADLSGLIRGGSNHEHYTPGLTHYGRVKLQIGNTWNVGVDNINIDEVLVLTADINHDCRVDLSDLGTVLSNYGRTDATAFDGDFDGDGDVDLSDLGVVLAAYGTCVGNPGFSAAADFDQSGCIDLSDLGVVLANYGS